MENKQQIIECAGVPGAAWVCDSEVTKGYNILKAHDELSAFNARFNAYLSDMHRSLNLSGCCLYPPFQYGGSTNRG